LKSVKLQSPLLNSIYVRMLQPTLPAGFIAPCLPTKTDKLPSGSQWLHEIKHDGFRIIARKNGAQVRLYSRPGNDLTHRFPLIVDTLARLLSRSCIIDGEAVAYNDSAVASFDLVRYARANDSMCIGVAPKWGACPVVAMTPTDNHSRRPPLWSRLLSKPENRYRSCKSGSHLSWLRMIKRAVKKILEATGFELRRININHKFEPEREDRFKWIRNLNIQTVLDVGANTGEFAGEIHAILPEAAIYSFEPLRDCYDLLVEKMSPVPKFRAFDFALGSEASEIEMHRSEFTPSSSILRMSGLHKQAFPFTSKVVLEKVAIKRLDDVTGNLDLAKNILIKIDVQGFEDRVIAGGLKTIQIAKLLIVETSFESLYDDQPLFDTIYEMVKRMGFAYHGNLNFSQLSNPIDGNILQADAIFIKS